MRDVARRVARDYESDTLLFQAPKGAHHAFCRRILFFRVLRRHAPSDRVRAGLAFCHGRTCVFDGCCGRRNAAYRIGSFDYRMEPDYGAIPPLTEPAWLEAFEKYKAIPQYRLVNAGMEFTDFKFIFWWEWSHRQLGRAIGIVFALGFFGFLAVGKLRGRLALKVLGIGLLGGLQGGIGWLMVRSGLDEGMTAVAPIKLMFHLTTASLIYTFLLLVATGLGRSKGEVASLSVKRGATLVLLLALLQIALGALVAGSKAGLTWNTWPLIDGQWIPRSDLLFPFRLGSKTLSITRRLFSLTIA